MEREKLCDCIGLARPSQYFMTKHHPYCDKYDPERDAHEIIKLLLSEIRNLVELKNTSERTLRAYNTAAIVVGEDLIDEPFRNED